MSVPSRSTLWQNWSGVLPAAGLALLPFLIWRRQFAELFWFGDEWDLLDQIERAGLWHWTWTVFAENFVPFFKLLWGGAAQLGGGSYFVMLLLLWLTHAANTALLGRLLRRAGFGWFATLFTQVVFAVTPGNLETLGWSVQWSAVLATTFMLLPLDSFFAGPPGALPERGALGRLVAHAAGSAFSFSRGVLTGGVLALACLWPEPGNAATPWRRRLVAAALCLVPAVVAAGLIITFATGNHQHPGGDHLWAAANYGLWYFCLNPLHRLLEVDSWGPRTVALLGLVKVVLVTWGLLRTTGRSRLLLGLLLAFDLGNSALLGLGRYHTGLETTISSRYQYGSLIAILPFLGLWLESFGRRLPAPARRYAAGLALAVIVGLVARHWPAEVTVFAAQRGTQTRQLLFQDPNPPAQGAVPGIPSLSTARAKELAALYHLH